VSQAESHDAQPARRWADPLAGLFAAMALFLGLVALAYHPLTISVAAFLLGFLSLLMSARHEKLAGIAIGVAGVCFVAGMSIAVLTDKPLW
jgi:hypothetical protein